jgi:hypothetical protein
MKLQKREYSSDDLAGHRRVVDDIEGVLPCGMIDDRDRKIVAQHLSDAAVERLVETRHLIATARAMNSGTSRRRSATDFPTVGLTNPHCFAASATVLAPLLSSN